MTNPEADLSEEEAAAGGSLTHGLSLEDLHSVIRDAAAEKWRQGDFTGAVRNAWFALRDLLRVRLGRADLDNENLVNAIGETSTQPALPLTEYTSPTERNIHRGVVQLLRGTVFYVRHPEAHESASPVSADRVSAFECLTVMSLCARYVASAASPTVIDDVIAELREPRFPTSHEALDDIVRTIPRRRLAEFVEVLHEQAVAAYNARDHKLCDKLWSTYTRALSAAGWDPEMVRSAAARATTLIARDETLVLGFAY
ncbi:MAG TPA: TIGR02391 family protein [Gaiellaceae bacterium]|nr:TIGR02391 family protein [Gaiellaceae bacterium]